MKYPNDGELVQYLLRDLLLLYLSFKVLGLWGPLAVIGTYIIGTLVNMIEEKRKEKEESFDNPNHDDYLEIDR